MLGPAGAGKSTVSIQFVVEAVVRNQKAAVYVFDEVLGTLFERSDKLCLNQEGGLRTVNRLTLLGRGGAGTTTPSQPTWGRTN